MYTYKRRAYCGPVLALSLVNLALPLEAATVVGYTFDDSNGDFVNAVNFSAPGILGSAWTDADGTLTDFAGVTDRAIAARNFADGNSLSFSVSVDSGMRLELEALGFAQQASTSGPTDWTLSVAGVPITAGTTTTSFRSETVAFNGVSLQGTQTLTLGGTGAASSSGTWRIDDVVLSGNLKPVPLPPTLALLASSLILLQGRARRINLPRRRAC